VNKARPAHHLTGGLGTGLEGNPITPRNIFYRKRERT